MLNYLIFQASLTEKFEVETKGDFDFNGPKLKSLNETLSQRSGVSFDECALLCLGEQSFICLSFTYGVSFRICKWSSFNANVPNLDVVFDASSGINLFRSKLKSKLYSFLGLCLKKKIVILIEDLLANYIKYEFQVTTDTDYIVMDVSSANDCAYKCNTELSFKCRSFNVCDQKGTLKCLLSHSNIHRLGNVTEAKECSHYSSKNLTSALKVHLRLIYINCNCMMLKGNALDDFKMVPRVELSVLPQTTLKNISLASCAEQCVLEEGFLCRSFNYYAVELRCTLYKENLVDQINTDLKTIGNEFANLYSRLFYEKDGKVLEVVPLVTKDENKAKSLSTG